MTVYQTMLLILLTLFYLIYFGKMLLLKKQGISANLLAKGDKPHKAFLVESFLRIITVIGALIQFGSVLFPTFLFPVVQNNILGLVGAGFALLACLCFLLSVMVMKNNWRAGFEAGMDTSLVTDGIYQFSRNPAFLGFDLLYVGCALAFPNLLNLATTAAAIVLFHYQILGEEQYLTIAFGKPYKEYTGKVRRYFGKKES